MKLSEFGKEAQKQNSQSRSQEAEDLMSQYERLKDLPDDQLSKMLLDEVAKQKRDGTFDYDSLSNMVESMRAYMGEDSYQNIKRILETFK